MRYKSLPRFLRHFFSPPPHSPVSDGSVKGTARTPPPLPQTRIIYIFCPRNERAPDGAGAEPGPRSEPRTQGLREAPGSFPTPVNGAVTAGTAVPGVGVCYGGLSSFVSLPLPPSSPPSQERFHSCKAPALEGGTSERSYCSGFILIA